MCPFTGVTLKKNKPRIKFSDVLVVATFTTYTIHQHAINSIVSNNCANSEFERSVSYPAECFFFMGRGGGRSSSLCTGNSGEKRPFMWRLSDIPEGEGEVEGKEGKENGREEGREGERWGGREEGRWGGREGWNEGGKGRRKGGRREVGR